MQTTLFMAISANGMIVRENGSEDFLSHENWLSFCKAGKNFGNFIWGRKTYEAVQKWGGSYFEDLRGIKKIVVSKDKAFHPEEGFIRVSSPAAALKLLAAEGFKKALLCGGATLNSAFAKAGLLERIRLNIEPAMIGAGVSIFARAKFDLRLKLLSVKKIKGGLLVLEYKVMDFLQSHSH